jgi:hypothetical protein
MILHWLHKLHFDRQKDKFRSSGLSIMRMFADLQVMTDELMELTNHINHFNANVHNMTLNEIKELEEAIYQFHSKYHLGKW